MMSDQNNLTEKEVEGWLDDGLVVEVHRHCGRVFEISCTRVEKGGAVGGFSFQYPSTGQTRKEIEAMAKVVDLVKARRGVA